MFVLLLIYLTIPNLPSILPNINDYSYFYRWALFVVLMLFLTVFGCGLFDWVLGGYFNSKFFLGLGPLFSIYWVVSIFIFLFNESSWSLFTSVIQRYWKRALYLFWGLELFLFGIYIYLTLNAPTEVEWLLDQPQLFLNSMSLTSALFLGSLYPLIVVYLIYLCPFSVNIGHSFWLRFLWVLLIISVLSVLMLDLSSVWVLSAMYFDINWNYDYNLDVWELVFDNEKLSTSVHYNYLLSVLKLWHTCFIVVFTLISTMFLVYSSITYQGLVAANNQNFLFLFLFTLIPFIPLFNSFMSVSYQFVYKWFIVYEFSALNLSDVIILWL